MRDVYYDHSSYVGDVIKFNQIFANFGNGFDGQNGIFTAPKSGLYQFHFSAQSSDQFPGDRTIIEVNLNDQAQLQILDGGRKSKIDFNNISYTWTFHLKLNDKLTLQMYKGDDFLYVSPLFKIYFIGHLIVAD